ncbi:diaminopimelate epimerase [bacterium]|nr:diaminopimelate epimerase [bacterium]
MVWFQKMHGLGNHFILFDETVEDFSFLRRKENIRMLCDVSRGIGADGVGFVQKPLSRANQCKMRLFNSDGSEAEMCGNGIRCVAHHYRSHFLEHDPISIETLGGVRKIFYQGCKTGICFYKVEMGKPSFDLEKTGELVQKKNAAPLSWNGELYNPVYVNVGNPHAVIFLEEPIEHDTIVSLGAWLETHPNHPRRINIEFVETISQNEVKVSVWERGCGMTQACGTGATAVFAAGIRNGKLKNPVVVHMPGGELSISLQVLLTGSYCPFLLLKRAA